MLHQSNLFCRGFDHANLVSSFRGSNLICTKNLINVYFLEYERLKYFIWKDYIIFARKQNIGNRGTLFKLAVIDAFCWCAIAEKRKRINS